MSELLRLENVVRRYKEGEGQLEVFSGLDLTLKPGQLVSAKDLALEWNVSRTPVRDALIRLARERLVVVYAQAGTFVSRIDLDDVEEARFARMTLECAAITHAMNASEEDLAVLRSILDQQWREVEKTPAEAWAAMYELDAQLHQKLIEISGHPMIWDLVRVPLAHMERVRRLLVAHSSEIETAEGLGRPKPWNPEPA